MARTRTSEDISTRITKIAELAKKYHDKALTPLSHHIDLTLLKEAFRRTRKDGAPGIDGKTMAEYGENLEENLEALLTQVKTGIYRAPPVRRVYIPKGDGRRQRPIGIPTVEDKVRKRAVLMVLEPVYEQEFYDGSYGFRPGRSAHDALAAIDERVWKMGGGSILEADIEGFFGAPG